MNGQLVIDEIGMMYLYPATPVFSIRSISWVAQYAHQSMASRDYVQVNFLVNGSLEDLLFSPRMVEWEG